MPFNYPTGEISTLLLPGTKEDFYTYPTARLTFDLDTQRIVGDDRHGGYTRPADMRAQVYKKRKDIVLNRQSVSIVGAEDLDFLAEDLGFSETLALESITTRIALDREREALQAETPPDPDNPDEPPRLKLPLDLEDQVARLTAQPKGATRLLLAQCLGTNIVIDGYNGTDDMPQFNRLVSGVDFGPYSFANRKFADASVNITRPNLPCDAPGKKLECVYLEPAARLMQRFIRNGQDRRGFVGMIIKSGHMAVGDTVAFIPFGKH